MEYDVFLSHNSNDKPVIELIAQRLSKEYGLKCWLDKWNLVPGEPWQEALEEALDQCRTVAVFVGPDTISPWENEEMRAALETRVHTKERRVVPVLLPGAPDGRDLKLPRFLSRLTWVDFRNGLNDENALYRLYCGIQGIRPGADNPQTETEGKTKRLSIFQRKITAFFQRSLRKRLIWFYAIGIAVLVIAVLGLSGNLFIDLPLFCGGKLSSTAGYINRAVDQRDAGYSACALQSLQNGFALQPTAVEQSHLYYLLATVHLNRRAPLQALEDADTGLQTQAGVEYEYLLYASRGFAYCQLGQNADATREFNIFLNSQPERAGSLADTVNDLLADFATGKDMRDVCWLRGAETLP